MRVKVLAVSAVAEWRWGIDEDVCGICRNSFESCCPGVKYPGDDCPPVNINSSLRFESTLTVFV